MRLLYSIFLPLLLLNGLSSVKAQVKSDSDQGTVQLNFQIQASSKFNLEDYKIENYTCGWKANETAIVICDMWDKHWCKGATQRTAEMAPKMNKVITTTRDRGIHIVHAPGGCMKFYRNHPARKNALKYSGSVKTEKISTKKLATENHAKWPIDDSDGGCDCSPECKQHHPWKRQIDIIQIKEIDLITDSGEELLSYFHKAGIKNVILMGVHTNMCIINRPYGLRSMINSDKNAVLMRDLTDSMYDSKQWPYVSHFDGTRLMIDYIEKYICPTIVSSDITQNTQFNFADDNNK